jgi:hypothetical protein
MSDPDHPFAAFRPGQGDAAASFVGAMREAWDVGAAAWRAMAGGVGYGGPAANPFARIWGPLAGMATTFSDPYLPPIQPRSVADAAQGAASQVADMTPAMAQAWMVATASTLRYWRALADIHARHQGSLMQAVVDRVANRAAPSPAECRVLADELRAFLREIGDAASLEARRLQAEMELVGESIARATDQASPQAHQPSLEYRRHYRAKE